MKGGCDNTLIKSPNSFQLNKRSRNIMEFLKTLGIKDFNPGAYFGNNEWSSTQDTGHHRIVQPGQRRADRQRLRRIGSRL